MTVGELIELLEDFDPETPLDEDYIVFEEHGVVFIAED